MSFQTVLLIIFPCIIAIVFLIVRLGFLWLERDQIAQHTRNIYIRTLFYAREKDTKEINLDLLAFRQALYGHFFSEKRIYKIFIKRLKDFTSTSDTSLETSYEFLEHTVL